MNFHQDLARIAYEELMQAGIAVPASWDDYHICLNYMEISHRWFDSSISYAVVYSKELLQKFPLLSTDEREAIKDIEYCLRNCKPITPYMSRLITDTSIKKSDFLLKNWDIYHLHLEKLIPPIAKFTKENLLFFQAKGCVVHFIDVKKHPTASGWFDRGLLEIIYNNWPHLLRYLYGMKPTADIPDNEVHSAFKHMVGIIDFHGGSLFPTNMGVTTSGNSSRAVQETDRLFNRLALAEKDLLESEDEIKDEIFASMGKRCENLDYELITENGYFVAYETTTNAKIRLFPIE